MDKKKKIALYVMLPLVIAVWGYIFFRIIDHVFSEPVFAVQQAAKKVDLDKIESDTFEIVADYRDPFLGGRKRVVSSSRNSSFGNNSKANFTHKTSVKTQKKWPAIQYKGMIKNNDSKKKVGIAVVNGKEQIIKQGDVIQEITFLKITKKDIKVRFQRETKTINK